MIAVFAQSAQAVDSLISSSTGTLLQWGIGGVFILVLLVAVYKLYRKNEIIQEQRLVEAKEVRENTTELLKGIAQQQEKMYDVLLNDKRRG